MPFDIAGTMLLGEGTPSYDSELEVDERLPWEHVTGTVKSHMSKALTSWKASAFIERLHLLRDAFSLLLQKEHHNQDIYSPSLKIEQVS